MTIHSHTLRGGSWFNFPRNCRSARRCLNHPGWYGDADDVIGFRVVCLPQEVKPTQVAIRGGSHAQLNYPWCRSTWCRSACRGVCHSPGYADDDIGFRVICLPSS
jgi:formylglycine-generating enzyme required for sulfatase activity